MKKRRGRYTDPQMVAAVKRLTAEGVGPKAIHGKLFQEFPENDNVPGLRTVWDIADEHKRDTSDAWSVATAELDHIEAVLPFVAYRAKLALSYGDDREYAPRPISKYQADRIARIRRAAPDLPIQSAWNLANYYVSRHEQKQSTADLDLMLSFGVWRSDDLDHLELDDLELDDLEEDEKSEFKCALADLEEPSQADRVVTLHVAKAARTWKLLEDKEETGGNKRTRSKKR